MKDEDIAPWLLVDGFPDVLWAFARLMLFDNVHAFVNDHRQTKVAHPCAGLRYSKPAYNGTQRRVDWKDMFLSKSPTYFVHVLSHRFEPKWWQEYRQAFAGSPPACVGLGGLCPACDAEDKARDPEAYYRRQAMYSYE